VVTTTIWICLVVDAFAWGVVLGIRVLLAAMRHGMRRQHLTMVRMDVGEP
jgi:hypothetical protein